MALLSIIIPVYNLQDYLSQCLNSICNQSIEKLEVIIVNDGSTDNSRHIADSYAQKYNFIKVLHQSNQGVSVARNNGVEHAKGEYIWFVDGDDLIAENSICNLIKIIEQQQVDAIIFNIKIFFNNLEIKNVNNLYNSNSLPKQSFINNFPSLLKRRVLSYSPCDKLIRRKLILKHNIQFNQDFISAEDYYWNYHLFKIIHSFIYVNQALYFYRKNRKNSATTLLNNNHLNSALYALEMSTSDTVNNLKGNINFNSFLLYSSQLFFYNLPEFYRAGLLNQHLEKRLYDIYKIYMDYNIELKHYNSGAEVFELIFRRLPWHYTLRLYSQLINLKRYLQLNILKKTK